MGMGWSVQALFLHQTVDSPAVLPYMRVRL
jgi:hypothetical protein